MDENKWINVYMEQLVMVLVLAYISSYKIWREESQPEKTGHIDRRSDMESEVTCDIL